MSSQSKGRLGKVVMLSAMMVALCMFSLPASAQDQPPAPKWELYGGYSVFYPGADVHGQLPGALLPLTSRLETNPRGIGGTITYNFNRWFGLSLDGSNHWGDGEIAPVPNRIDDTAFANLSFGPKITFRSKHFSPFLEALVGDHRLSPAAFHRIHKLGVMVGGGIDINLSKHVAWRILRVDYALSNYRFGPSTTTAPTNLRGFRFQMGLNFTFGGEEPSVLPSATCQVLPHEVYAGEPVTATAAGSNFHPNRTVKYDWSGTGVKVSGSDSTTQVDTTGLQPGTYGVTANLSDGRKNGSTSCSGTIIVREPRAIAVVAPRPPVITCAAEPARMQVGGISTINSNASSPDGRKLTYSYSASSGEIFGSSVTATLNTRGLQPGRITVTCNVNDDHNPSLSASATTMVNLEAVPEIAVLEARLALHSIYFQTDRPFEALPEGGLVDSQEEILRTLAEDYKAYLKYSPNAHLVFGGHADVRGSKEHNMDLTQRRVNRTKSYLVEHGVPADHIETQSFGEEVQLTEDQLKEQIAQNPDLSPDDKQVMLNNLPVMLLANNRRVDVYLNTTGQQSTHRYPFNASDYLALIKVKSVDKPK